MRVENIHSGSLDLEGLLLKLHAARLYSIDLRTPPDDPQVARSMQLASYNGQMPVEPRRPSSFFARQTLLVARGLLGSKLIHVDRDGTRVAGWIIETEAYVGPEDLGCHAHAGYTARNANLWGPAGHAYVYFTYGMHWMFNVVTERAGFPAAVLIRALQPAEGVDRMRRRRGARHALDLTDGPAKICQALRIDRRLNGADLCMRSAEIWIERGKRFPPSTVTTGPRVGLNTVPEPWKSIPWRFRLDYRALQSLPT
jgi:DNA-3-methyladenine glycosylase